jgi:iron complex outermembrane receptor protein
VRGAEGNLNFRATEAFSVHGSAAYNLATFDTFANASCYGGQSPAFGCVGAKQDLSGRPLARAPKWVTIIGGTLDHPLTSDLRLGATVDAQYTSRYFLSPVDSPYAVQGAYSTVDASLRLRNEKDNWELAVIGKNLSNKFYAVVATDRTFGPTPGSTQGIPGAPRTVMLQGRYSF